MCGIAGILSFNSTVSARQLQEITRQLSHRGPDAEGFFRDDCCALGHRRLSILDLSEVANQPMHSQDGRYVIVFNGEVYNFREIAASLNLSLRTTSDTEVILEAFAREGVEAVQRFNGMFAFAVYDTQQQELYLFRDRLGIKPVFYFYNDGKFAFASELKSLTTLPEISAAINQTAISQFLHAGYIPAPHTIYQHIYKLLPGHYLKITRQGVEEKTYWDLPSQIAPQPLRDEAKAKAQLEALLTSSVKYQLISDVPLGVLLSGGIDSSTVAALAARNVGTKLNTFSIGFREGKFNEAGYAAAVAKHLGTQHHEFIVSSAEAKDLVESMLDAYDEPYADSSAIPTMLVSRLARQHVTVALCGDGGDELFLGYGMYQWAERLANPLWQSFRKPIAGLLSLGKENRYRKGADLFAYENVQSLPSHIFSQEQGFFAQKELQNILQIPAAASRDKACLASTPRPLKPSEKQALFDLQAYLPDDLLTKVDRATMRYGLEARVPLLDHRVVEFALNLSPELKLRNGVSKYLLKEILYQYVPRHLFDRPKWGFSIPLADWLRGDLKYLLDQYLDKSVVERHNLVKYESVSQLKTEFLGGNSYVYNRLWALLILHRWFEKHTGMISEIGCPM